MEKITVYADKLRTGDVIIADTGRRYRIEDISVFQDFFEIKFSNEGNFGNFVAHRSWSYLIERDENVEEVRRANSYATIF